VRLIRVIKFSSRTYDLGLGQVAGIKRLEVVVIYLNEGSTDIIEFTDI